MEFSIFWHFHRHAQLETGICINTAALLAGQWKWLLSFLLNSMQGRCKGYMAKKINTITNISFNKYFSENVRWNEALRSNFWCNNASNDRLGTFLSWYLVNGKHVFICLALFYHQYAMRFHYVSSFTYWWCSITSNWVLSSLFKDMITRGEDRNHNLRVWKWLLYPLWLTPLQWTAQVQDFKLKVPCVHFEACTLWCLRKSTLGKQNFTQNDSEYSLKYLE